jgi:malonyl-ACP decarboxylase
VLPGPGPLRRAALLPPTAFEVAAVPPGSATARLLRGASPAARSAAVVALQAAEQARLAGSVAPEQLALLLAGHNLSLAGSAATLRAQAGREGFAPPRHALQVWDTHTLGVVAELLSARGPGLVAGGHFASGVAALQQAALLLRAGAADAALCVAPCAELSDLELHALANLGATASLAAEWSGPYQPFGPDQAGFIYGQGAACLVVETAERAAARGAVPLAGLGAAVALLGGRAGPEPSAVDEARAMRAAIAAAGLTPGEIDYVNAHATGTPSGDAAEAAAVAEVFGIGPNAPWVNATKAIAGHTLFAAGLVGAAATILQMREGFLHPDPHLTTLPPGLRMVGPAPREIRVRAALCNAFGFDGINGSIVLTSTTRREHAPRGH